MAQDVVVTQPWVRGTVAAQKATGAFMEVTSKGGAAIVAATSPVAGVVEIHEMSMAGDVMKMRAIARLDLPAGKAVQLKPGGYHIMLMDLKQPLKAGETVPITLRLEGKDKAASTMEIKAEVRDLTAAPPPAHEHKH
jgi:copper(I)-binding protein